MILNEKCSSFDLYIDNKLFGNFSIPLFGKHMVMDAAAAIIVCYNIGLSYELINKYLPSFKNAKRRFAEEIIKDTVIIDDYAHHPTEIKVTLEGVKQKYPNKRIVVVFRPNTYSRTKDFLNEFVEAFNLADKSYITEIDSNRENKKTIRV